MKKYFLLSCALGLVTLFVFSCKKTEPDLFKVTNDDQELLQMMKVSYENARLYNDSLEIISNSTLSDKYDYCDSAFHYYVNCFDSLHSLYPHNSEDADHYHDNMGMHMMDNMMDMMDETPWTDGHHDIEHNMMDELISDHDIMFH